MHYQAVGISSVYSETDSIYFMTFMSFPVHKFKSPTYAATIKVMVEGWMFVIMPMCNFTQQHKFDAFSV